MPDDAAANESARERLAAQQARLVAALGGVVGPPEGFDAERITLTSRTLVAKRRKSVARAWPVLAEALGPAFAETFNEYARGGPPPADGPGADALAFAKWLDATRQLPPAAVPALVAAMLGNRSPFASRIRRHPPRRLLIGVRLPWLGVKLWSVPFFAR